MSDIINNIGVGQAYTTVAAWWSARPNDGNNWIGNVIDAGVISVGELTGTNTGGAELRADEHLTYNFFSPTEPHVTVTAANTPIYIRATDKFIIRGLEVINTGISTSVIAAGAWEDCDIEIHNCRLIGGKDGINISRTNALAHLENCVVSGAYEFGICGRVAGVTASHTVVTGCNISNNSFRSGIQTTVGAVFDNTVAYNNTNKDWIDNNATASNCASGDTTAFGTSAITGVVAGDFEDVSSNLWTTRGSGVLSGAGTASTDIGLAITIPVPAVTLTPVTTESTSTAITPIVYLTKGLVVFPSTTDTQSAAVNANTYLAAEVILLPLTTSIESSAVTPTISLASLSAALYVRSFTINYN